MPSQSDIAALEAQLQRLLAMSPPELRIQWPKAWGSPAPRWSAELLRLGIAYKLQEKVYGGLKQSTLRELNRIAAAGDAVKLRAGTQLVRSWHGRTVSVLVADNGFVWESRTYASLTAIAREVTGAGWSGPRFFGLKDQPNG